MRRLPALFSLLVLAALPISGQSHDLFVSMMGNDAAPGTKSQPWRTLQHAADRANSGDTVTVRAGVYAGFQMLHSGAKDRPIRFRSAPGEAATIESAKDGVLIGESGNTPKAVVRYVEVSGFHMKGGADTWNGSFAANGTVGVVFRNNIVEETKGNHGILAFNSHDFRIENNTIRGAAVMGIRAARSFGGVIRGNHVSGCGFGMVGDDGSGIYVNGSQDILIENNTAQGNKGNGILTELSDALTIQRNTCLSNGWAGIWIDSARGGLVTRNVCRDNGGGIWASQTQGGLLTDVQIIANICDSNTRMHAHATRGGGIWLREGTNVAILNNVVYRNGHIDNPGSSGIFLGVYWGSSQEVVKNAVIRNNLCVGNLGSQFRIAPAQIDRNNRVDHNDFQSEGTTPLVVWGEDKYMKVAAWQKASRQGAGTLSADPRFVNPTAASWQKRDFHLRPDSPYPQMGA
ncbi:MAG: right-handed parallel beta-helix repeat-containing protein, partial [Armatimonadota bacterium]|nr:right-handed parallel beta-helix repeat-containing protein [Armatimonadota bacterium]